MDEQLEQVGGHDNRFIKFGPYDATASVMDIQIAQEKLMIFGNDVDENQYSRVFMNDLTNLMHIKDNQINVDFINNFHRQIYFDNNDKYSISSFGSFSNPSISANFKINHSKYLYGSKSWIYFITDTRTNKKYVLKAYNLDPNIKDYLSLEFVRLYNGNDAPSVSDASGHQTNYVNIDKETFKTNDKTSGMPYNTLGTNLYNTYNIPENYSPNLLIGCPNNNFYNDILINLILRKIYETHKPSMRPEDYPFILYHNFYISRIGFKTYGFVLMDTFRW